MTALRFTRPFLVAGMILAISFGAALSANAADAIKTGPSDKGEVLTDTHGMTLYVFDKDSAGKSACNGKCAENWPPLMADAGAMASGKYSIITRDDGSHQWAVDGKPLYRWKNDHKPGDTTGDGFLGGKWHAAKP